MKALEVFGPKDIRSCARILGLLENLGLDLSDLQAHAEHLRFMGSQGRTLVFPNAKFPTPGDNGNILDALGYETLAKWRKIKGLFDKAGLDEAEIRAYVRKQRKVALKGTHWGGLAP